MNLQNVYIFFGYNFENTPYQPRAKTARSAGRKQKRPVLLHTGYGEKHQKANGTCSLKKVISVPFMYVKYESKNLVTLVLSV